MQDNSNDLAGQRFEASAPNEPSGSVRLDDMERDCLKALHRWLDEDRHVPLTDDGHPWVDQYGRPEALGILDVIARIRDLEARLP